MICAVGLGGYVLGAGREAAERTALPVLRTAPSYTMTNQLGATVGSKGFRGKVQLVTFLFPYCTTFCPLIAAHLANLENLALRPAGLADAVQIVSFNVDPTNTGPKEMREFLSQYGWDPHDLHWQYLTGAPKEVRRVVRDGFGIAYARVDARSEKSGGAGPPVVQPEVANALAARAHADYDISHNDALEVVDPQGRIRKIYDEADTVSRDELLGAVRAALSR